MTMDEKRMYQQIRHYSYVLMVIAVLLSLVFFFEQAKEVAFGIIIGTLCGIMGFNMIVKFSEKIDGDSMNVSRGAYTAYMRRYLLYAVVIALSAYAGLEILAVLVGLLCHKAAIVLVSFINRKEDE